MKTFFSAIFICSLLLFSCSDHIYLSYDVPKGAEAYLAPGEVDYLNDTLFFYNSILFLGSESGRRPLENEKISTYVNSGKIVVVSPGHEVFVQDLSYTKKGKIYKLNNLNKGKALEKISDQSLRIQLNKVNVLGLESLAEDVSVVDDPLSHHKREYNSVLSEGKSMIENVLYRHVNNDLNSSGYAPKEQVNLGSLMEVSNLDVKVEIKGISKVRIYSYRYVNKYNYDIKITLSDFFGDEIHSEYRSYTNESISELKNYISNLLDDVIHNEKYTHSKTDLIEKYNAEISSWQNIKISSINNPTSFKQATSSVVTVSTDNGHGSGVVISNNGYIITNHHVITGEESFDIITQAGDTLKGALVRSNPKYDMALIKCDASFDAPVKIKSIRNLDSYLNEKVYAVGTPVDKSLKGSITKGIITGHRKFGELEVFQTSAVINPGNSGGALLNERGQLLGIINAKMIGYGVKKLGYSIPSSSIEQALKLSL